jgi:hypothetical protein
MTSVEQQLAADDVFAEAVYVHQITSSAREIVEVFDEVLSTGERSFRLSRKQLRLIRGVMLRSATAAAHFYELASAMDESICLHDQEEEQRNADLLVRSRQSDEAQHLGQDG